MHLDNHSAANCTATDRLGRNTRIVAVVVYGIMIITGHATFTALTSERRSNAESFATQFNDLYCSARTFEACVQGNERDILVLMERTNTTIVLRDGESVSNAAFSIWTRCVQARTDSEMRLTTSGPEGAGYSVAPAYKLFDDCNSSHEVDAWCGRYELLNATLPVAEHLAMPSPFAANLRVFASYVGEFPRLIRYMDALLGTAVGCMVLAALSCKALEL